MRRILNIFFSACLLFGLIVGFGSIIPNKEIAKAQESKQFPFGFAGPSAPDDPEKLGALGTKYIREGVSWQSIEPTNDNFNFSFLNNQGLFEQYGLELIPRIILGNNSTLETADWWATSCDLSLCSGVTGRECPNSNADCPPTDINSQAWDADTGYSPNLTDYVTKTLEEIYARGKNIEYFIVGNEINSWTFWHGTAEDYLKTRATIYNATKKVNTRLGTSFKIVDSGIAGIWGNAIIQENFCTGEQVKIDYAVEFANRFFDRRIASDITRNWIANNINCNGSRDYLIMKAMFLKDPNLGEPSFDLMAFHFYEPWDTLEESIDWINNEMQKNDYIARPIINTEGGYRDDLHIPSDDASKQNVANDIPKLHLIAFNKGVKAWLWLPFTERNSTYENYGLQWKGLIGEDQTELPAYNSYKTMVEKINGFSSIEKIVNLEAGYVYKINFTDKNPIYVIWDTTSKTVNLQSTFGENVKITNVDGQSEIIQSQNISISESPIYIEELLSTLSIQKQVNKSIASSGEILTYRLDISNPTSNSYTNSRIEDSIPVGTTYLSSTNGGILNSGKVIWNIGSILPGNIVSVSFQVIVQ